MNNPMNPKTIDRTVKIDQRVVPICTAIEHGTKITDEMKFDNWCNVGEPKHGYTPLMCWMRYRPDEPAPQELLIHSDIRL